jgi:transcription antitermination factor NusG
MTNQLAWYALRVLSQREDMVKKHLIYRGHKAYTKLEKRFGKWTNGKRTEKEYVAAPGYVFLGASGNPWMEVHNCHLIRSVVSVDNRPAQLNPEKLGAFLEFDDFNLPDYFKFFREPPFVVGDTVRIDHPSYEGFELPVRDIRNHEAIFSLVMFGRETELKIPVNQCFKSVAA